MLEKAKDLAIDVVELCKEIKGSHRESVLTNQLLRSGTSIGANIHESKYAHSKADFISKLYISLKEANETKYWLSLLEKADYLAENEAESIQKDLRVIIGTLVNTIKKTKELSLE